MTAFRAVAAWSHRLLWNAQRKCPDLPIGLYRLHPAITLPSGDLVAGQPPPAFFLADFLETAGLSAARRPVCSSTSWRLRARWSATRAIGSPSTIAILAVPMAQDGNGRDFAHLGQGATGSPVGEVFLMNPDRPDSLRRAVPSGPLLFARHRVSLPG